MLYINKQGTKPGQHGARKNIQKVGALTREATKAAEEQKLGVLKSRQGDYRIIKECGLGHLVNGELVILKDWEEVNNWFINNNRRKAR